MLGGIEIRVYESAFQLVERVFITRNGNHEDDNGPQHTVEGFYVPDPLGREARLVEMSPRWPPGLCWSHYMGGSEIGGFQFILIVMHPDEREKFLSEFPAWGREEWLPLGQKELFKTVWDHLLADDQ